MVLVTFSQQNCPRVWSIRVSTFSSAIQECSSRCLCNHRPRPIPLLTVTWYCYSLPTFCNYNHNSDTNDFNALQNFDQDDRKFMLEIWCWCSRAKWKHMTNVRNNSLKPNVACYCWVRMIGLWLLQLLEKFSETCILKLSKCPCWHYEKAHNRTNKIML